MEGSEAGINKSLCINDSPQILARYQFVFQFDTLFRCTEFTPPMLMTLDENFRDDVASNRQPVSSKALDKIPFPLRSYARRTGNAPSIYPHREPLRRQRRSI